MQKLQKHAGKNTVASKVTTSLFLAASLFCSVNTALAAGQIAAGQITVTDCLGNPKYIKTISEDKVDLSILLADGSSDGSAFTLSNDTASLSSKASGANLTFADVVPGIWKLCGPDKSIALFSSASTSAAVAGGAATTGAVAALGMAGIVGGGLALDKANDSSNDSTSSPSRAETVPDLSSAGGSSNGNGAGNQQQIALIKDQPPITSQAQDPFNPDDYGYGAAGKPVSPFR